MGRSFDPADVTTDAKQSHFHKGEIPFPIICKNVLQYVVENQIPQPRKFPPEKSQKLPLDGAIESTR